MRTNKPFARVFFTLLACLAVLLYGFLAFAAFIGLRDALVAQGASTVFDWIGGVIHALFIAGFPTLMLIVYFWLFESKTLIAKWGFAFVPLSIALHYPVALFMAHGIPFTYIPMMLLELGASGVVIWYWVELGSDSNCL